MRKKNNNSEILILGLLFLALFGKGALAAPRPPSPDTTSKSPGDTSTPGDSTKGSGSPGNNSSTDSSGSPKSAPDPSSNPTYGNGVPDKSKTMSSPGTMPGMPTFMMPIISAMDNAGVKFAQIQTTLINAGKSMAAPISSGLSYIMNLGGDPGASVTTAVYNPQTGMYDSYTNNEYLLPTANTKSSSLVSKEMNKQVMPPMMMQQPTPIPSPPAMNPPMMMPPIYPLSGLVDPNTLPGSTNPLNAIMNYLKNTPGQTPQAKTIMSMMMQQPQSGLMPGQTPTIPNPLSPAPGPDLLSMLLSQFGGFGQAALNSILSTGQSLTGAFQGLPAIPGLTGARPVFPDVVV